MLSSEKMAVKRKLQKILDIKKSNSQNKLKTHINIITTVEKNSLTNETKLLILSVIYL